MYLRIFQIPMHSKRLSNSRFALSTSSCLLSIHSKFQTGQAIVLAPSGLGLFHLGDLAGKDKEAEAHGDENKVLSQLGRRYIVMKTRRRVTADGGASLLVVESS